MYFGTKSYLKSNRYHTAKHTVSLREEKERKSPKYKSRERKSLIVRILTTKNLILSVNEFYMARAVH